jgi:uncharacterized protein (TIGR02246 family)
MTKAAIEAAIHSYIRAWNAQDFTAMAAHFTEPAVFILPSATRTLATRAELAAFLRGVFEGLNAAGFDHTEIGAIEVWQCAEGLWAADVSDIRRFHRDGSLMETIEVQYALRLEADGQIRLISALWCDQGWRGRKL